MKNKKGFTLIELLVVIALMLSILGIAVVSLINISNKKKEEAWQQVEGQIETAAENTSQQMNICLKDYKMVQLARYQLEN